MQLTLSDEEQALLADLLDGAYRNLKEEINKTETHQFRDQLKERERLIVSLLERVRQGP